MLPFETVRDTKIQTFQYRILHRIIPCNKRLHNIKNKDSDYCDYCGRVDDILHFFKKCPKVNDVWSYWINGWDNLSEITIKNSPVLEKCIFGCPLNRDAMKVLNLCILYTIHIYIQHLFNKNKLDLYACLAQVKLALEIECNICKKLKQRKNTFKFFNLCCLPEM